MPKIKIDNTEIIVTEGTTILQAADLAKIYIPHICSHPDLPPVARQRPADAIYRGSERIKNARPDLHYEGCRLCVVEIEGLAGLHRSCSTAVSEGMVVHTVSPDITELRRERIMEMAARHPHACLTCFQKAGCVQATCSLNIPESERCCGLFASCEFRRVVEYVGLKPETTRYVFADLPIIKDEPLFSRNFNLCIGCMRCIRVCRDVCGIGVFDFIFDDGGQVVVGTLKRTLKESSCRFCVSCVEVCPTGALREKEGQRGEIPRTEAFHADSDLSRRDRLPRLQRPAFAPRHDQLFEYKRKNLAQVPEVGGVYQLLDAQQNIIYIKGTINLRKELMEQFAINKQGRYFVYEENPLYSMRESELLQHYLTQFGEMPELNQELDALF